ncbi:MAE_28990/MAE_18760 family HEPN-like nuclease [Pantoea dispersa]|uniref:MAE_28990/MAE_18760 family HEPN-like nuclease n=1 Tax=Pantoea dispersa TaxID=59814 RepID=UPI0021C5EF3E|nr:MAE_28990/MAE_18760 family HEPN-like nuclease [Pantoea dispersa]
MLFQLATKASKDIEIVKIALNLQTRSLDEFDGAERTKIRQHAFATSVTRIYAVFESFVNKALSDYLDFLSSSMSYDNLPVGIKDEYRIGISHVLSKLHHDRFKSLIHETLIDTYHKAINNYYNYQFVTQALIRHDANLKLEVISSLFSRLQLKEFDKWIENNHKIISLYEDGDRIKERFDAELKKFIQDRNDSSHGLPENIGGETAIMRYCLLIEAAINAITSYLNKNIINLKLQCGTAFKVGVVTEVFEKAQAYIAKINSGAIIDIQNVFYFCEDYDFYAQSFGSIQVDGAAYDSFIIKDNEFEVGLSGERLAKKRTEIFYIT